jgi:hypothetical protein
MIKQEGKKNHGNEQEMRGRRNAKVEDKYITNRRRA